LGAGAAALLAKRPRSKGMADLIRTLGPPLRDNLTPHEVSYPWLAAGLIVLALIPIGTIGRDFCCPYKSPTDARYRDFARWFWPSTEFAGETACLYGDLGLEFAPGT